MIPICVFVICVLGLTVVALLVDLSRERQTRERKSDLASERMLRLNDEEHKSRDRDRSIRILEEEVIRLVKSKDALLLEILNLTKNGEELQKLLDEASEEIASLEEQLED